MIKFKKISIRRKFCLFTFAFLLFINVGCNQTGTLPEIVSPSSDAKKESLERGEQIVGEYLKRDFSPYRKSRVRLTITEARGATKIYVLEVWRKQTVDETRTMTRIIEPPDERDLAALSIEQKGKPTVNVNYVASSGKFRESGTNKMFFGGLTTQELLGEWDKYSSRLLAEKETVGARVFEVESVLKPDADSVIKRIVTLFRADDFLPVELHLFDNQNKELRTFRMTETRTVENRKFIRRTEIENHIYKSKILIEILDMTFAEKLPDEAFEREYLKKIARK